MFETVVHNIVEIVSQLGYAGIVIMMFLESTFFPFPSEVVMIPAGMLAATGEMNIYLVILLGVLGSVLGALFNFFLAFKFGRIIVLKFGKYFFFKEKELEKMEAFFHKHGAVSTFTGRLIPGIRQYISLPAGLAKMNVGVFALFTALGAGIWSAVLALIGFYIGDDIEALHTALMWTLLAVSILIVGYYIRHRRKRVV
jgi:membrane protein DedA with SNARE-associated domain